MLVVRRLALVAACFLCLASCGQPQSNLSEEDNPNYQRGQDFLKQGREEDAMEQFLKVLDASPKAFHSHLELGRLFLQVEGLKDPLQAIYHFRRFLQHQPEAREAANVNQLIATAEKQFLAGLPAKPFGEQLDAMQLRELNKALEREVVRLKTRLARHEPVTAGSPPEDAGGTGSSELPRQLQENSTIITPREATYVVKRGDTLSSISLSMYGSSRPHYIDAIYDANRQAMPNKNSLRLGQQLTIPKLSLP